MKKFFIFGAVAIVLSFAVALGVKSYRTTHNTLFYKNLEALANPEDDNGGGGSDPGSGGTNPGGGGESDYDGYAIVIDRTKTCEVSYNGKIMKGVWQDCLPNQGYAKTCDRLCKVETLN